MKNNLYRDLNNLSLGQLTPKNYFKNQQITDDLIKHLKLEKELTGHQGCVNCLEWNETGELLASGSDDTHIRIWDPFNYECKSDIITKHQGNIFSVKFMPKTNNNKLATGAADSFVKLIDISKELIIEDYKAHLSRVKRLTISPNDSNLLWSCSEDGTIRQFDIRQPYNASTANVLLNFVNISGSNSEIKCLAINPIRTDQIAVGSNDPYVRLFDRRKLSLTHYEQDNYSRSRTFRNRITKFDDSIDNSYLNTIPDSAAQYFIPGHIPFISASVNGNGGSLSNGSGNSSKLAQTQQSVTYLTFSPDGRQLLVNMGSEQIYLYDVAKSRDSCPTFDFIKSDCGRRLAQLNQCDVEFIDDYSHCDYSLKTNFHNSQESSKLCQVEFDSDLPFHLHQLKEKGNLKYKEKDYLSAVITYNKAINKGGDKYARFFANRAAAYISRQWTGDMYAALYDSIRALQLEPDHFKSHFRIVQCLFHLNLIVEANDYISYIEYAFAEQAATIKQVAELKKKITDCLKDCKEKESIMVKKTPNGSTTLKNGDVFNEELDLEKDLHKIVEKHLKIRRYSEHKHHSKEIKWRRQASDYKHRYCGHCNTTTDIKEANFFGLDGRYIMAGSDDGNIFFWQRDTENLLCVFRGDSHIVNCLQPHPTSCLLATSGIDSAVRLWSAGSCFPDKGKSSRCRSGRRRANNSRGNSDHMNTTGDDGVDSDDDNDSNKSSTRSRSQRDKNEIGTIQNELDAASNNQERLSADPFEVVLMNMGLNSGMFTRSDEDDDDDEEDDEEEDLNDISNEVQGDNADARETGTGTEENNNRTSNRFLRERRANRDRQRRFERNTFNSDYCRPS